MTKFMSKIDKQLSAIKLQLQLEYELLIQENTHE